MPKTSKYIDDEEGDQEYNPSNKAQEDVEEFEEEPNNNKKRKRDTFASQEPSSSSSSLAHDDDGNPFFTLSNKRRITIRKFSSGDAAVDIREVYLDKNTQKMRPGKGICLPMNQYLKLIELLPEIDNAIKSVTKK